MVKVKTNKKAISDNVYAKKSKSNPFATARKINPFEVHINKEKFNILGRTCKHERGLPGISRAKAVQNRKNTIGKEFSQKHRTNEFRDRRIGWNSGVVNDKQLNARFVAEKMSPFIKHSVFNLNDDEVLTHHGQTLEEIELFHDNRSDDEASDDVLDANFTEAAHFGGEDFHQDRKAAIEQMIAETKLRKAESAKEKNEIFELTNKLDNNLKEIIPLMGKLNSSENIIKPKLDDYDKALREMIFEPRSSVCDRMKSEKELACIEKQRLQKLESEMLLRMLENENTNKLNHRSADDLDDGYFLNCDSEEVATLAYDLNGESLSKDIKNNANKEENESETLNSENEEESNSEINETDDDTENEEDGNSQDTLSDFKNSSTESETEDDIKFPNIKPKAVIDKPNELFVKSNIPFTVEMPLNYNEFKSLLSKHNAKDQGLLIARIIECHHPKLDPTNKENINKLFTFLLQYLNNLFVDASTEDVANAFKIFNAINPFLYDLIHLNTEKASISIINFIREKYSKYKQNSKSYPTLETLVFLKIVSNLYTTSDYRHKVVTPCFVFISHILSKARVRTRQDVAMGLFLVTLVLEYSQYSKRFIPSALNFLVGVIYMSLPKKPMEKIKIVPPFMSTGPFNKILAIAQKPEEIFMESDNLLQAEDLVTTTITVNFKIRAINTALRLTKDVFEGISENIGVNLLAQPFLHMMEKIDFHVYPKFVNSNYEETKATLVGVIGKPLQKLLSVEKKPKTLRLFEPRIETVYDDKRRPKISKVKEEKVKLIHKIRRETKGAVREIRRDTDFLQKVRINQQIQSDRERKEKVKRIWAEAADQQGELNELKRKKKKM